MSTSCLNTSIAKSNIKTEIETKWNTFLWVLGHMRCAIYKSVLSSEDSNSHRFIVLGRSKIGAIFRRKQVTVGLLFYGGQKLVLFSEESKSLWVCCFMEVRNWCYLQKKASHCRFVVLWRSEIGAIFRRKQVTVGLLFYGGQKLVLSSEESKSL